MAVGAFGAHGLSAVLEANDRVATWETAVLYQLMHALAIWILAESRRPDRIAAWCFSIGILIFSGTLYVLCLTQIRWLGAITPIGGVLFLVGWGRLIFRKQASHSLTK